MYEYTSITDKLVWVVNIFCHPLNWLRAFRRCALHYLLAHRRGRNSMSDISDVQYQVQNASATSLRSERNRRLKNKCRTEEQTLWPQRLGCFSAAWVDSSFDRDVLTPESGKVGVMQACIHVNECTLAMSLMVHFCFRKSTSSIKAWWSNREFSSEKSEER